MRCLRAHWIDKSRLSAANYLSKVELVMIDTRDDHIDVCTTVMSIELW